MLRIKKKQLSMPVSVCLMLAISVIITLYSVCIQPGEFYNSLRDITTRPLLVLLNLFPAVVMVSAGAFAFGNVFFGSLPAGIILPLLSYVNLLKIEGREDAFVPSDIGLIREAMQSATGYSLNMHIMILVSVLALNLLLAVAGCVFKMRRVKPVVRAVISASVLAVFALSVRFVYTDKTLYDSFPVEDEYNIPSVFNTLGFNYCFLHNFNLYPVDKPENFSKQEVEEWIAQYSAEYSQTDIQPNVIMVMGEAFADITNGEAFIYESEQDNPIHKFNLLKESERSIIGHIVVSNVGAGTANTEFDILTGTPTNMISDSTTSAFRVIHRETPSIVNIFNNLGYNSYFMHPGSSWFYNRSSVYSYLGIRDKVFSEGFNAQTDSKGNMISDSAFLSRLKADIAERKDTPQFMYTVTLQNHLTYNYAKYGFEPALPALNTDISDRAREYLSVYCEGVRDTSDMIYELAQYIDTLDRPTLLVFFGDHIPNLGEDYLTYSELSSDIGKTDTPEQRLCAYETPFLIYANTAFCSVVDFNERSEDLSLDGKTVSDIYLGAAVCELAGYSGCDPYIDFLNEARRTLPVFRVRENLYMSADGTIAAVPDDSQSDIIYKIDRWQYYRLKY